MNCEASERSSELARDEEEEVNEFKREIEERFKLSIANKLYTFPKRIRSISDLLSSSDSESEDAPLPHPNGPLLHPNLHNPRPHNFRKKSKPKESPGKELEKSYMADSVKKGKDKLKTTDSTNKGEREKHSGKLEKTQQGKKEKKKHREPEPTAFLETIRNKMAKKNWYLLILLRRHRKKTKMMDCYLLPHS